MDIDSIIASYRYGAHVPYIIYYEWKVYGSSRKHLLPENTQKHQKIYRVLFITLRTKIRHVCQGFPLPVLATDVHANAAIAS